MNREAEPGGAPPAVTVRVWDAPVRQFHWLLVALVCVSVATGKVGGNAMKWHLYSGFGVLFLLLFRLLWGVFGSTYARFSHFLRGPAAVRRYIATLFRRAPSYTAGHNPLGATLEQAQAWALKQVTWYNGCHLQSAIGFVTPAQRHAGDAAALLAERKRVYEEARARTPRRWSRGVRPWQDPEHVWLNPPPKVATPIKAAAWAHCARFERRFMRQLC